MLSRRREADSLHDKCHRGAELQAAPGGQGQGSFPSDEAATKLLFLVLNRSEKEWIMPPREWCMAKAQFAVLFGERFTRAMA
jgi:Transposase and inactivated derivatives